MRAGISPGDLLRRSRRPSRKREKVIATVVRVLCALRVSVFQVRVPLSCRCAVLCCAERKPGRSKSSTWEILSAKCSLGPPAFTRPLPRNTTITTDTDRKMTRFRPCIDLHAGSVKQIVGGTLNTTTPDVLKTNWTSEHPSAFYADLYKQHDLTGAHVIMLGPGNDQAAQEALEAWKGGMQVGGGITEKNAAEWIERGADKVSFTP